MLLWGYRSDEVILPKVWPKTSSIATDIILDPSIKIISTRPNDRNERRPVAGTLGMHVEGAACPHPDLSDTSTTLEGALYRVGPKIPGYEKSKKKFRKFVKNWCKKNLKPLAIDADTSTETWLKNTPYTVKRKEELLQKHNNIKDPYDPKLAFVKSFIKDEFYPEYKHARAINSRTDEYKTLVGPIFQLISDEVFARPEFIKKVPINKRPETILRDIYVQNQKTYFTDFSSFEAHFRRLVQEDCEFVLYKYMTRYLPERRHFLKLISALIKTNRIEFKNILMKLDAKRMSGEMNTSLGNGFSNLMFILYVCHKKDPFAEVKAKVEGDDSVFTTKLDLTTKDFADFGLRIKLGYTYDVCRASFCGMVFDPIDMTNVSDPREVLATFGWTSHKYIRSKKNVKMTLLRCKALSLAYQYPSCPILSSLAKNTLRLTRSYEVRRFVAARGTSLFNAYELEIMNDAINYHEMMNKTGQMLFSEPGMNTRNLVEELYNITKEQQVEMEKYFDAMEEVSPLCGSLFLNHMPDVWKDYFERYSGYISPNMAVYERPGPLWPKVKDEYVFL